MKKLIFLITVMLAFSLAACGTQTPPDIQTPDIENVKEDVTQSPTEENVIPEPTATPEPTPEPTATPEPTPKPKDLIGEGDYHCASVCGRTCL